MPSGLTLLLLIVVATPAAVIFVTEAPSKFET